MTENTVPEVEVEVDETVAMFAQMLKTHMAKYNQAVIDFRAERDARKSGEQTAKSIFEKVSRKTVSDQAKQDYDSALSDFMSALTEIAEESPGVWSLVYNDLMSKSGRTFEYILMEATSIASTVKTEGPVMTIEELSKMKDKCNGLWTALEASAEIPVIQALGVSCAVTKKGRAASGDKETWRPNLEELPKVSAKTESTHLITLTRNGTVVWKTQADGKHETLDAALKAVGVSKADFNVQVELAGQSLKSDLHRLDFVWNHDHWKSEVSEA